jgi:hypothetical protein
MSDRVLGHTDGLSEVAIAQMAAEKLRNMKKRWGVTWAEMADILGVPYRWKSLSVYAAEQGERFLPPDRARQIIDFDDSTSPELDKDPPPTGIKVVLLWKGDVYTMPFPDVDICHVCGTPFIIRGYGQKYCKHDCKLEARRERYHGKQNV